MKKALIVSASFNVVIILFAFGKRLYYSHSQPVSAATTTVSPFDQWNAVRSNIFAHLNIDSNDIVFVGTSLTEGFPVTELFGRDCKNRGIGGNKTSHILQRIPDIVKGHPRKIFIEAGINDLAFGGNVDSTFENYKRILSIVKRASPNTRIYVQSTMPTCGPYDHFNTPVKLLNDMLVKYCERENIQYIDINAPMTNGGSSMDSTLTEDGLHINGKGYVVWQKTVEKYIR